MNIIFKTKIKKIIRVIIVDNSVVDQRVTILQKLCLLLTFINFLFFGPLSIGKQSKPYFLQNFTSQTLLFYRLQKKDYLLKVIISTVKYVQGSKKDLRGTI